MNRNIAAVSPLRLCARKNERSGTTPLRVDEGELLGDQRRLLAQELAPLRNLHALETHPRHGNADRGDPRVSVPAHDRHADATQVRDEFLDIERESGLPDLRDLLSQLRLVGDGLRREARNLHALEISVELRRIEAREQNLAG